MRRSLLPLNALRVFDAAARSLSFTRAADELAVTPAAVGQQVRALEETLGVILFRRTAHGLELTAEAERSLPALRAAFSAFEETIETLQEGQVATRLSMAVDRAILGHWLRPRIVRWYESRHDVVLQLIALDGPVDFQQANFDLALSFGPAPDGEGIFGRQLGDGVSVRVARPGAPARRIGWKSDENPDVLVPDAGVALDLAVAGLGIAIVPLLLAAPLIEVGTLEERSARTESLAGYWLCAPEPQWKSAKVRELVTFLTED